MPTKILVIKKLNLNNAVLLVGLPGIGLVGKIAIDYLMKELHPEKIAEIYSYSFPPSVHTKDSKIELIHDEVFYLKKGKQDFLFLAGPVQPTLDPKTGTSEEHYEFSETLIGFFKSIGVKEIVTLAGINIGDKRLDSNPNVVVAGTDNEVVSSWVKIGAKEDKKEGLISGVAGLLVGLSRMYGVKGVCLMGETNIQLIYGDNGSAKKLIEVICKKYNLKIKMQSIAKDAKEIEKTFKELTKQLHALEEEPTEQNTKLPYVR
ncbi:MAG: PAC2 family protein [Candidatus ainarchaeum sp.]|nr:PAC2 family protein [Candidatus ainarchaeum sp.]